MNKTGYQHDRGFTLIELAIVLVIVGVLVGAFLSTLSSRIETTRRAEAAKQLETIKQALYGYAMSQPLPHLPCPDCRTLSCVSFAAAGSVTNDGIEDRNSAGACATGNTPGNLPWKTLGLGSGDAWGDRYSYWVSGWAADNSTGIVLTTSPNPALSSNAPATIETRVKGNLTQISSSAVAVIISQGKDGYGGMSVRNTQNPPVPASNKDEQSNLSNNLVFISRAPTKAGATTLGGEFDDMLVWISEYELKAKMVEAGVLPP